jgi:hypothetical protein
MLNEDLDKVGRALDALGSTLAGYGHVWSDDLRSLFDEAAKVLAKHKKGLKSDGKEGRKEERRQEVLKNR